MQLKRLFLQAYAVIRTFSFVRLANALVLVLGYVWSRIVRRPVKWGRPVFFSIEPSGVCNLFCPECPTGALVLTRPRGLMDFSVFSDWMMQGRSHLMHLNLFFQGEPLLHPDVARWVSLASAHQMYTLISTNGQVLTPRMAQELVQSGLTELLFSVDGLTQETYERYRVGGRLQKIEEAIRRIVAEKKRQSKKYPIVTIQFLVFAHNEHEVPAVKSYARRLEADGFQIKKAQFNDFGNGSVKPPAHTAFRRYANGTSFSPNRYKHCWKQWSGGVLTWDGKVLPCCFDKDASFVLGQSSLGMHAVWSGAAHTAFRQKILWAKQEITMCRNCPEGRTWWF